MKWKLELLLGVSVAMHFAAVSSASVTAVNPDKTISVDGEKTFPVGMQAISCRFYEYNVSPPLVSPFDPSQNAEFLFDPGAESYGYVDDAYWQSVIPKYAAYKIYWTVSAESAQSALLTLPYFFGYYQKDEPTPGVGGFPAAYTYQDVANELTTVYANAKAADPNHVVVLTHWTKMLTWVPCADVMSWDCYTIMRSSDPATGELWWQRADSIYAWEHESSNAYLEGHEVNDIAKPVWTVIQANGVEMPLDAWRTLYVPTPAEVRANVYTALTLDIKGIAFWGYKSWGEASATADYPCGTSGLYNDPALHAYYRQLAAELRSFNHILVLPTAAYSWEYKRDTAHVTFSPSLTRNILWRDRTNFNYLLKQEGDDTYLFVVNKDTRAIANVDVTVAGLSGAMTAATLGRETSGSQRAGRTLSVVDGKFTDSFDGYAVHIYIQNSQACHDAA